jgi:5-methylcytosine-specific restriction protein A
MRHRACLSCHELVPVGTGRGYCPVHAREKERSRYNAESRKWYHTPAWQTLKLIVRGQQPLCDECGQPGQEIDHTIPHRGDYAMFFNRENLRNKCKSCHSRKTQRGE